jgi:ubiquinone/menaquinone biosynthesis C-methylase UbiE
MDENELKQIAAQLRKPEGDDGVKAGESMSKSNKYINLNTIKILSPAEGDKVLEIGMGNGYFVEEILRIHPSITYTGCDHSEVMVKEAKKNNEEWIAKGQANFILADVSSIPVGAKSFNKVFSINTLYFWQDTRKVFKEIKRVLMPGGKLTLAIRPKHQMDNYPFTKYGFTTFGKQDLIEMLRENGFSAIQIHEMTEPDYEFNGRIMKMESLIAVAGV